MHLLITIYTDTSKVSESLINSSISTFFLVCSIIKIMTKIIQCINSIIFSFSTHQRVGLRFVLDLLDHLFVSVKNKSTVYTCLCTNY